jgi:saccharopine dehydrogenase-like NADP-dependent oxidoreductase
MVEVPAHSGQDPLEFKSPIGRVSAGTVIHSETATLPAYLKEKKIQNCFFKIVYPESVKRQLALMVGMGLSGDNPVQVNGHKVSPRRFVTALAQHAAVLASKTAATPADYEVLRVKITGTRHGRRLEKSWDCEIRPNKLLSAGAIGVGFSGAIATVMLGLEQGAVRGGVGAPESTLPPEVFFKELKARKSFALTETIAHPLAI